MPFSMLPVEVLHSFFVYLDHQSLLNCTSTNHYFREMRTYSILRRTLLNAEPKLPEQLAADLSNPFEGQKRQ